VRQLAGRVAQVLRDEGPMAPPAVQFPTDDQRALLDAGEPRILTEGDVLTVVAPDRPGLFSRVAGVLSLHGLAVRSASATVDRGWALQVFGVESSFGPTFAWGKVVRDLEKALAGQLAIPARLAQRARTYGSRRVVVPDDLEPEVRFDLTASDDATVVEVHAADAMGVLYRITRALAELDLAVVFAKVQTLGPHVVDSFYGQGPDGVKVSDPAVLAETERALVHALSADA
jgi:[protein-PII] uridylyltransferase